MAASKTKRRTAKPRRAKSTQIARPRRAPVARKKSNPAAARARKELEKMRGRLARSQKKSRELQKQVTEQPMAVIAVNSATVAMGGVAVGVAKGATGREFFLRLPVELWGAAATGTAAWYFQQPQLAYLGAGMLTPLLADAAEDLVADVLDGGGISIPEALFERRAA